MTKPATAPSDSTPAAPTTPARRRTRGPNKPKAGDVAIVVTTEASISQAGILQLLTDYVTSKLGAEAAAGMELQLMEDLGSSWLPIGSGDIGERGLRFATKGAK